MAITGYATNPLQATSSLFPGIKFNDKIGVSLINSQTALTLNVAANTILARSAPCPFGWTQKVQDFNFYVSTAGTGVAQLVRLTASGQIRNVILPTISSSQSGIGQTVLNSGEALAVIVGTQGTGTISSIDISAEQIFIGNEVN